ncbi:MAG: HAD hydrolase family protein [Gemmatimonadota bacterium]
MAERLPAELADRVRLVVLDVDGVLTDNGVYVGRSETGPVELKRFHVQDGLGIKMMVWAGIEVVLVSGRVSHATTLRAAELGIEAHQDGGARKIPLLETIMERVGADWDQVAMVADDLADLPVLRKVGLPVAVANGVAEVRAQARWCTRRPGGEGAVREFAEALLKGRGIWSDLVDAYCRSREHGEITEHFAAIRAQREGAASHEF